MNYKLHILDCRLWLLLLGLLLNSCGTPAATGAPTVAPAIPPPTEATEATATPLATSATAAPTVAPTEVAVATPTPISPVTPIVAPTSDSFPQIARAGNIIFLDNDGATLRTIRPDGSDGQVLTVVEKQPQEELLHLAATPDGRYLMYSLADYAAATPLRSFVVEGGVAAPIETLAGTPNVSPDGTRFVAPGLTDDGSYGGRLILYDLATRTATRLAVGGSAEWFVDGTRLLYLDNATIGTYDLASGATTTVVSLPNEGDDRWYIEQAHVLHPGEQVIFFGGRQAMLGASGNGMQWWVVPLSGGEPQAVTETGGNRVPEFAPNSQADLLAYSASFHVNVCISAYSLAVRASTLTGNITFAPLPDTDMDTRFAYIEGFSWAGNDHLVYGLRPYSCADTTDYQVGEASIYSWNARDGGEAVKIADGSYPIWIR